MAGGLQPPSSVTSTWRPNFINPETRGPDVIILVSLLLGACYIVIALRIWARLHKINNFGLDDGLIILSLFSNTGLAATIILGYTRYGLNKHVWDDTLTTVIASRKVIFASLLLYLLATSCTKTSILLFYRRLGSGAMSSRYRFMVYTAIGSVLTYLFVFVTLLLATCRPMNAFWNQVDTRWTTEHSYRCFDEGAGMLAASSVSMIEDFVACFLPMILLWKLKQPLRQKMALQLIFALGILVCVCGILRVVEFEKIYGRTYDITWSPHSLLMWTIVESNMAIICASAPSLHYFVRHVVSAHKAKSQTVSASLKFDSGSYNRVISRARYSGSHEQIRLQSAAMQQMEDSERGNTYLDSASSINAEVRLDEGYDPNKGSGEFY